MQIHPTKDADKWILQDRTPLPERCDSQQWSCRVENLIPPQFESYAKVLHCLEAYYFNIDNPLTPAENALLSIPDCAAVRSFIEHRRATATSARFRWSEIAEWLNVPFEPEITHEWFRERLRPTSECWPRHVLGPSEGDLNLDERTELVSILRRFNSAPQRCFFRFAEIPFIGTDKPILFEGLLDELNEFLSDERYQFSPEYWWPSDKSWCICSDYDLTFTIVAGSAELIDAVLGSRVLEAIRLTSATRVDSLVPIPEGRK